MKAAKLDPRAENDRVLRAFLGTPSVAGTAASFWKSYRNALVALDSTDDTVRLRLLETVPTAPSTLDLWLGVLSACGA